ncbi:MAG: hypothetical protein IPK21_21665 [Haliscomenobacter sp.]|nr:hypothetical protein [Haliscomenobacter sp.]
MRPKLSLADHHGYCGGAILPPVMGLIADNVGIQTSFLLPVFCFLVVAFMDFRVQKPGTCGYAGRSRNA